MEILNMHKGMQDFMARRNIPPQAIRPDGRLTLVIDGKLRIHLSPDSSGRLTLSANVMPLPGEQDDSATSQLVERLMDRGTGLLRDYASSLCIDPHAGMLQLRQSLGQDLTGIELDAEIGEFTNALNFWVRTGNSL